MLFRSLLLPAVIAVANLLPAPRASGPLCPQRRWLPLGFFACWIAATATHLYSLGYVYDFDLHRAWVAPALWALAWTLCRRITDFVESPGWRSNRALLIAPALAPFVAGVMNSGITLMLAALNAIVFGVLAVLGTQSRLARNLAVGSALTVIAAFPQSWGGVIVPGSSPAKFLVLAVLAGLILAALLSRQPKVGFLGSCALAAGVFGLVGPDARGVNWGIQAGCVFLLLHSLRWLDWREKGLPAARALTAIIWVLHSFLWAHFNGPDMALAGLGLLVLVVWIIAWQLCLVNGLWWVGSSGFVVLVSSPLDAAGSWLVAAPAGLLALIGSLSLFALGTVAALTKHRWHN